MRDAVRIDRMINKLRNLWKDNADQRLGQLILNLTRREDGSTDSNHAFQMDDDELELQLDDTIKHGWV